MKIFSEDYLNDLTKEAQGNLRKRQHRNIHKSYEELCQRLFNAIEPSSYIRPHRHATDTRDELLIAVRGSMALVIFDEQGVVNDVILFGVNKKGNSLAVGVEVSANTWHTVISLEPASVLLEVKAGPFDPSQPKDLAPWAPDEGDLSAQQYLQLLISNFKMRYHKT
jgi:cupin fold WbuC family metalloprotein